LQKVLDARLGQVSGKGLFHVIRENYPSWILALQICGSFEPHRFSLMKLQPVYHDDQSVLSYRLLFWSMRYGPRRPEVF